MENETKRKKKRKEKKRKKGKSLRGATMLIFPLIVSFLSPFLFHTKYPPLQNAITILWAKRMGGQW